MLDDKVQAFGKEAPSRQTRRFCGPNGGVEVCLWLFAGHRSQQFAPQNGPAQKERIIFQSHQFSGVSWRLALNFLGSNRSKPDKSQHLRYNQEFASAYKLVFHPQRFRGYIDFSGSTACDDFYFFFKHQSWSRTWCIEMRINGWVKVSKIWRLPFLADVPALAFQVWPKWLLWGNGQNHVESNQDFLIHVTIVQMFVNCSIWRETSHPSPPPRTISAAPRWRAGKAEVGGGSWCV